MDEARPQSDLVNFCIVTQIGGVFINARLVLPVLRDALLLFAGVFCGDAAENAGLAAGLDGADTGRAADCCSAAPKMDECKREDEPSTGIFDARANFEHGRERWTTQGEDDSFNGLRSSRTSSPRGGVKCSALCSRRAPTQR